MVSVLSNKNVVGTLDRSQLTTVAQFVLKAEQAWNIANNDFCFFLFLAETR